MRYFVLILSLFISPLSIAQDLVEFENGQVADADDLNQNLSLLMDEILQLKGRAAALEIENCLVMSDLGDGLLIGEQENQFGIDQQFTIAGWIRPSGSCPDGRRCEIVSLEQTNWGSPNESYTSGITLYIDPDSGSENYRLEMRYTPGGVQTKVGGSSANLEIGRWIHVAAVRGSDSVDLFVNGKALVDITKESYINGAWVDVEKDLPQGPIDFDGDAIDHSYSWIGRAYPNGLSSFQNVFVGNLSRIGIWPAALMASDIRSMYSNTFDITGSDPTGFWPLNQISGVSAKDLSSAANNGLMEGGASWSEDCRNNGVSAY